MKIQKSGYRGTQRRTLRNNLFKIEKDPSMQNSGSAIGDDEPLKKNSCTTLLKAD